MKKIIYTGQSAEELFGAREEMSMAAEQTVREIIQSVRENGDKALRAYAARFDGYTGDLYVTDAEIQEAMASLEPAYIRTLQHSIDNIREFHAAQKRTGFEIKRKGVILGERILPVRRAGLYIPGGTAAYPSTVLMNAIPAVIAGVPEIIMATPVKADGKVKPEVLAAAHMCGVSKILKIGGAQAIAALAYGTESVPRVDKITGPGNIFVATAKRLVASEVCGIDMVAGPSEILVVADSFANPVHVAADLLSQAEHDKLASALLICTSETLADAVAEQIQSQLKKLPREEIAGASIDNNCKIIICPDTDTAIEVANEYAPEHLELCIRNAKENLAKVKNAGSVFLGYNTPEAVGDYYAGANHTLPTSGTARFASPLGVDDFVKTTQYMEYTQEALESAADDIIRFAQSEGLTAHGESVAVRMKK
ncbi:MAG: histidinol dehydrogenase [Clostridia bacterium]|nr:histidinol dehydrogenase [Clostridia bacterium]